MSKAIYYISYKLTINDEVFTHNGNCIYGTDYNMEWNPVKFDSFDELWAFVHSNNFFCGVYADTTLFKKRKVVRINDFSKVTQKSFESATFEMKAEVYEGNNINELMRELKPKEFLEYCYDQFIEARKEHDDVAQEN